MARSVHLGWKRTATLFAVFLMVSVVSSCSKAASTPSTTTYKVFAQNFKFNGMAASIPAGDFTIDFSNQESFPITHEMILKALPSGDSAQTVIDSAKVPGCKGGGECETQYPAFGEIAGVDTGTTQANVFSLPAGNYFFACWETGTQSGGTDGPPHASKGMVFTFTVT